MSEEFGILSRQLERHFQKALGVSPKCWMRMQKIFRVRQLICEGNVLKAISLDLGFSNYDKFAQELRNFYHVSPLEVVACERCNYYEPAAFVNSLTNRLATTRQRRPAARCVENRRPDLALVAAENSAGFQTFSGFLRMQFDVVRWGEILSSRYRRELLEAPNRFISPSGRSRRGFHLPSLDY
ncbi:MAG: hypothetical protein M2R45_04065 [Verrucomicrobia subdivision 3 bacterium]|nr:hypothetical protein [Limisphaerales bacterium]MCS1417004.1 hypothetical protein [Limisphaerales bacterium]